MKIYFNMQKIYFCVKNSTMSTFMAKGKWIGLENTMVTWPQLCSVD